jgi:hypothetical protein
MASHQIPRRAALAERLFGIDPDGNVVVCSVYTHRRAGHELPDFYTVQYREVSRRIDQATLTTSQLTGKRAAERLEAELSAVRPLFGQSRCDAANGGPR